ncbi:MAG: ACT domain-containing protein [Bacillota bacterium]|nr:ACT domain-containing protein [Bacillota bacterium]
MRAIITVIGKDKVGIIAGVSNILAETGVNILDISQTIMEEYFTMIMMTRLPEGGASFEEIKAKLDKKGQELGVSIKIQHEDIFNSMHTV